ncbi:MAG: 50S ribosomal protein L11 methyltransferase [Chthonomonas sp.]|nr:50S ribosomal protein L11 methyltransferase [Chthonomonas sp.]
MKVWTQITATLDQAPEDWSRIHDLFERHGIGGTVQSDTPPTMSGYLFEPTEDELQALTTSLREAAADVTISEVPEEDWSESWKQFFVPRRIGKRFVIRPTWEEFASGPDDLVIVLDPGQSFGTGDHPTTRMCLELLETLPVQGVSVADVGCGSGVLSIGAGLLGAASIHAGDIEASCVISTLENAERNGIALMAAESKGFDDFPPGEYDLVLSNIISAALIRLAPETATRVKSGGSWIVSGVIDGNWPDVLEAAERAGFILVERKQENEWTAAHFRR